MSLPIDIDKRLIKKNNTVDNPEILTEDEVILKKKPTKKEKVVNVKQRETVDKITSKRKIKNKQNTDKKPVDLTNVTYKKIDEKTIKEKQPEKKTIKKVKTVGDTTKNVGVLNDDNAKLLNDFINKQKEFLYNNSDYNLSTFDKNFKHYSESSGLKLTDSEKFDVFTELMKHVDKKNINRNAELYEILRDKIINLYKTLALYNQAENLYLKDLYSEIVMNKKKYIKYQYNMKHIENLIKDIKNYVKNDLKLTNSASDLEKIDIMFYVNFDEKDYYKNNITKINTNKEYITYLSNYNGLEKYYTENGEFYKCVDEIHEKYNGIVNFDWHNLMLKFLDKYSQGSNKTLKVNIDFYYNEHIKYDTLHEKINNNISIFMKDAYATITNNISGENYKTNVFINEIIFKLKDFSPNYYEEYLKYNALLNNSSDPIFNYHINDLFSNILKLFATKTIVSAKLKTKFVNDCNEIVNYYEDATKKETLEKIYIHLNDIIEFTVNLNKDAGFYTLYINKILNETFLEILYMYNMFDKQIEFQTTYLKIFDVELKKHYTDADSKYIVNNIPNNYVFNTTDLIDYQLKTYVTKYKFNFGINLLIPDNYYKLKKSEEDDAENKSKQLIEQLNAAMRSDIDSSKPFNSQNYVDFCKKYFEYEKYDKEIDALFKSKLPPSTPTPTTFEDGVTKLYNNNVNPDEFIKLSLKTHGLYEEYEKYRNGNLLTGMYNAILDETMPPAPPATASTASPAPPATGTGVPIFDLNKYHGFGMKKTYYTVKMPKIVRKVY